MFMLLAEFTYYVQEKKAAAQKNSTYVTHYVWRLILAWEMVPGDKLGITDCEYTKRESP